MYYSRLSKQIDKKVGNCNFYLFTIVVKEAVVVEEVFFDANGLPEGIEVLEDVLEPAARAVESEQRSRIQELGDMKQNVWKERKCNNLITWLILSGC